MLRKLLVVGVILGTTTSALANPNVCSTSACPSCAYLFVPGFYAGFSAGPRVNLYGTSNYTGLEGTAFLGYGGLWFSYFYGAAEGFVGNSIKLKNSTDVDPTLNGRSNWTGGFAVFPGILIADNVLGFARVGVEWTQLKNQGNKSRTAWQVGIGAQSNLVPCVDLRTEYIYAQYNRQHNRFSIRAHQFNLGVLYKF